MASPPQEKSKSTIIPINRISTIMKSSSDVDQISKDSKLMMARAAELFIKSLAKQAYKSSQKSGSKSLEYKPLAELVSRDHRYEFLSEMLPKKITVLEYKKMQAKRKRRGSDSGSSSSDEEEDSSGSDSDTSSTSSGSDSTSS